MSCWPPSPCDRLSRSPRRARHRPRLLRGLRPTHDRPSTPNGESSRLDPAGCRVETDGPAGWFPRSPDHRLVREVPSSTPAASPRLRRRLSPGLPTAGTKRLRSRTHSGVRALHTGPYPPDLEPASRLRSVQHWFAYAAPSDLARRARTVWQYRHGSPSRGRLPPTTVVPGDRLPRCFIRPLRRPNRDGLSPPLDTSGASWRTAPPRRNSPLAQESRWRASALGSPARAL
jgi:hypothetical protein